MKNLIIPDLTYNTNSPQDYERQDTNLTYDSG